jgi:hypothetical protein
MKFEVATVIALLVLFISGGVDAFAPVLHNNHHQQQTVWSDVALRMSAEEPVKKGSKRKAALKVCKTNDAGGGSRNHAETLLKRIQES